METPSIYCVTRLDIRLLNAKINMDPMVRKRGKFVVGKDSKGDNSVLKIVVTDGTTETAFTLVYRIFTENIFGANQPIFVSFYEFHDKAIFLESVAIELTSFSPNLLNGVSYGHDDAIAFKDADIVFCIGSAREYEFTKEEYSDSFFKKHVHTSKFYGEAIEKYAKKTVRVIVLGNIAATIISQYAKSIPPRNISALSMLNLNIATAHIAARAKCLPTEIKNIIIWGSNYRYVFPDCRYMYFTNGKTLSTGLQVWLRNNLPHIMKNVTNRPSYVRSMAYGLAEHCKILWNGSQENEWTCMGVLSDHSYGVRSGICFSYPVFCRNRQYEIVQGLVNDHHVEKYILDLSKLITRGVQAAYKECGLNL